MKGAYPGGPSMKRTRTEGVQRLTGLLLILGTLSYTPRAFTQEEGRISPRGDSPRRLLVQHSL